MAEPLTISVFSDVICPWCFLGKRRLEQALEQLGLRSKTAIRWLPFELNPDMPPEGMTRPAYRARKFGAGRAATLDREMTERGLESGINFAFDRIERTPNARNAHLLIAHATRQGLGAVAAEALFTAYFEKAQDIRQDDVLIEIATTIALDSEEVRRALNDESLRSSIVDLENEAARLGVAGVPFFIVNDAWAVSGAQPESTWLGVLRQLHSGPEVLAD